MHLHYLSVLFQTKKTKQNHTDANKHLCKSNPVASDKAARPTKHMNHRNKFMCSNKMFETVTTNTHLARGADLMPAV